MDAPFDPTDVLGRRFVAGLHRLLGEGQGLGAFVLVLNNALLDPEVRAALGDDLPRRFAGLADQIGATLADGAEPAAPPDDLLAFLKLAAIGWGRVQPVRRRAVGAWRLVLMQTRALRPARAAAAAVTGNRAPFDAQGFHFDKPFLRREAFWEGHFDGVPLELLYNKFPFAPRHALVVPERTRHRPQWLDRADHALAWGLAAACAGVAGAGLGYNSYGAHASINQLHFQLFVEPDLPVEARGWRHNGGDAAYPADCIVETDSDAAWQRIDGMQRAGTCFNLLYRPGRVYCWPRRRQGEQALPPWCGGLAWYELAGALVLADAGIWQRLAADEVAALLAGAGARAGLSAPDAA